MSGSGEAARAALDAGGWCGAGIIFIFSGRMVGAASGGGLEAVIKSSALFLSRGGGAGTWDDEEAGGGGGAWNEVMIGAKNNPLTVDAAAGIVGVGDSGAMTTAVSAPPCAAGAGAASWTRMTAPSSGFPLTPGTTRVGDGVGTSTPTANFGVLTSSSIMSTDSTLKSCRGFFTGDDAASPASTTFASSPGLPLTPGATRVGDGVGVHRRRRRTSGSQLHLR
jgi:hypothetical protein